MISSNDRVAVVGPGAMGCLYAALLAEGGVDVLLLDYRPARAAKIEAQGIIVVEEGRERAVHVPCRADVESAGTVALVIIFTKAYDTAAAIEHSLPVIGKNTAVLTLQNGLGNYQQIARHVPLPQVLAGTTTAGAAMLGVGKIQVASRGEIVLGSPAGEKAAARRAIDVFAAAGLNARMEDDVEAILWRKALVNAAINPLTALTGRRNGELLEDADLRRLLGRVADETYSVGEHLGIGWGEFDPRLVVEDVCRKTASNRSSMLQDVQAGRRTEIDSINGYIWRQARQQGLPAPLNEVLTILVKAQQPAQAGSE